MKHFIQNQKGYTFFLVFATLIIFTVLGISLISITLNGVTKNKTRQDIVHATDLADKGIEFIVNDIQKYLKDTVNDTPLKKDEFNNLLNSTINNNSNLKCDNSNGITINTLIENGMAKVCIEKVENLTGEENKYKRKVTFKSTGTVNGKEKITRTTVIFGTDVVPDQLKYAVSTNEGGNLHLHGGVEIQGDIKSSGNVIIVDKASWGTATGNTNQWTDSIYPRIIKNKTSVTPKLILPTNKYVYKFNLKKTGHNKNDSTNFYFDLISGDEDVLNDTSNFTRYSPTQQNEIRELFFNTENLSIITRKIPDDTVNIDNEFNNVPKNTIELESIGNYSDVLENTNNKNVYYINKDGKKFGDVIYINGNKNTKLAGTFYVNGDVNIKNTTLYSDAILYVKGKVHIDHSILKNLHEDSTLFIFATGDITFSNMYDSKTDAPNVVSGFFYTKSNMHFLGVLSRTHIIGGISGHRVILTGVRGTGKNNNFDSPQSQRSKDARLQIIYDEDLIAKYHSFKRDKEEEYITDVNDPETIQREF